MESVHGLILWRNRRDFTGKPVSRLSERTWVHPSRGQAGEAILVNRILVVDGEVRTRTLHKFLGNDRSIGPLAEPNARAVRNLDATRGVVIVRREVDKIDGVSAWNGWREDLGWVVSVLPLNGRFWAKVEAMAASRGVELFLPPPALCTDNAAMAGVAFAKLAAGQVAGLDVDVTPGLVRPGR